MPNDPQMMSVQRELGAITEALKNADNQHRDVISRLDALGEKVDRTSGALANVEQVLNSSSAIMNQMATEKCGIRLDALEAKTVNLPNIETEIMFWRRVLGGGAHAIWKIGGALTASGTIGAFIAHWWK